MKELHIEKFDALLSLAAAECVKDEAIAFVSADISGVEDNPQMLRKILGMSKKSKLKALKIIVLVALLCMSIAFTACMLVREIRNVIWNVFVKERESSVEIGFDTGEETETITESLTIEYPQTIEKKVTLAYVPNGCIVGAEIELTTQYQIYYYTSAGDPKFTVIQSIISGTNSFTDNESGPIAYMQVNSYKAILIEHNDDNSMLTLTWQDDQYRYSISGTFSSINELVDIAENVNFVE